MFRKGRKASEGKAREGEKYIKKHTEEENYMKKLAKKIYTSNYCKWCGKTKDDYFYGDMCSDCRGR